MAARPLPSRFVKPVRMRKYLDFLLKYLPVTLVATCVPMVGVVDAAAISTLGDARLIGAIAASGTLMNFVFFSLNFLRTSTTALVAQASGAGDGAEAFAIPLRAAALALGVGVVVILLQQFIGRVGLDLLGISGATADAAEIYLGIRFLSVPAFLFNFVMIGWLLGQGRILTAMALQAASSLLNMALCALAIFQFKLGVGGVALATVATEFTVAICGLTLFVFAIRRAPLQAVFNSARNLLRLRHVLSVNSALLMRSMILFFTMAYFTRQSASLGPETLAINAVLINVFYLLATFMDGSATGAQRLVGQSVGQRSRSAFGEAARIALTVGGVLALLVSLLFVLVRHSAVELLTSIPAIQVGVLHYFAWPVLAFLCGAPGFVCDGIFIGATWARDMRNLMALSALVFLALWALLMPGLGNLGLWLAFAGFQLCRSITYVWRMKYLVPLTFPSPKP